MRAQHRVGITHKVSIAGVRGFITVTQDDDGYPVDVFIHGFGKLGSAMQGWADAFAIMLSKHVQVGGTDLVSLARVFLRKRFEPYGETDNPKVPYCDSLPDYVLRYLGTIVRNHELRAKLNALYKED